MLNGGMSVFFPAITWSTKYLFMYVRSFYTYYLTKNLTRQRLDQKCPNYRLDISGEMYCFK